jgi:DNA replication and repair protein RecF
MFLKSLSLQHFRNHASRTIEFRQPTTVIVGPNAQGKTSIMEAIALLASGNSFRAEKVEEMISFGQELARVKGVIEETEAGQPELLADEDDRQTELEVVLTRGLVQGKKTALRLYSVNNVRRRKREFSSNFTTVVFRPEDMRLVEGSPSRRRDFLDSPLCALDKEYDHSLTTYDQALQRRNRLLQQVREGEQPEAVLTFWNLTLVKHGEYLAQQRRAFLDFCASVDFPLVFSVEYDHSPITPERIKEYQSREIAAGHTLIGPHKDDLIVKLQFANGDGQPLPVATYGSRGQQRLAVLWLKMCEFRFLHERTQQTPLLLLDDILSELDTDSREKVLSLLHYGQAVITTTEARIVEEIRQQVGKVESLSL